MTPPIPPGSTPTAAASMAGPRCWPPPARAGLQVVVDIVPNHLGIGEPRQNPYWWDVLTFGKESAYADWFDIDWSRPITVPVLGDDAVLGVEDGELTYYEHRYPAGAGDLVAGRGSRRRAPASALSAGPLLARRPGAELPPLLHCHDAGGGSAGGSGGVRGDPSAGVADGVGRGGDRLAGRSPRWTGGSRSSTSGDWPGWRPRRGSPWRRSWSRASSCRTGRWPAPPATTRCGKSVASSSTLLLRRPRPSATTGSPVTSSAPPSTSSRASGWSSTGCSWPRCSGSPRWRRRWRRRLRRWPRSL